MFATLQKMEIKFVVKQGILEDASTNISENATFRGYDNARFESSSERVIGVIRSDEILENRRGSTAVTVCISAHLGVDPPLVPGLAP